MTEPASVTSRAVTGGPAVTVKDAANMAKDAAERAAEVRDKLDIEVADHEGALTNRVASPPPVKFKGGKDTLEDEGTPAPISAPSIGTLPVPPNEEDVKLHELAGYRATALQGAFPGETAESFEAREKERADEMAEARKDAAKDTKTLTDAKHKQQQDAEKAKK
jgi:hypothetical protein